MALIGVETLHVKDMTTRENNLRLNLEILEANTAAVVRIISSFALFLYLLPVFRSEWQRRSFN